MLSVSCGRIVQADHAGHTIQAYYAARIMHTYQ